MARNFRIDVGSLGTLVGQWDRDFPTFITNCSVAQAAEAILFYDGITHFQDLNRIFQQSGAGTYSAKFFMGSITLSGGNPEDGVYASVNLLPSGFTVLTAIPKAVSNHPGGDAGFSFTITALGSGIGGSTSTTNTTISYIYNSVPTILLLSTEEIGVIVTHPATYGAISGIRIEGTYDIVQSQSSSVTLETTTARVGDKIQLSSTTPILDGVDQIVLTFGTEEIIIHTGIDGNDPYLVIDDVIYYWRDFVVVQSPFQMWFYLPPGFRHYTGPVILSFIGNGTQFSGSVAAGTLQILFEDATGIYVLDKTQTSDLLYFRDGFTTDSSLLFLPSLLNDNELLQDDFFAAMTFPTQILAENNLDESPVDDYTEDNFLMTAELRVPVSTLGVEIPSPFIKTAFLP